MNPRKPHQRAFLKTLFVIVALGMCSAVSSAESGKPNIILILTDDQGYAHLGATGHPWLETPHLDQLCAESTSFSDFNVSPTCSPTRSALMTGNFPFKNGVTHTGGERERLALKAATLPQYLSKLGYTSGIFGKWHLGDEAAYQPENRGFDEVFIHGAGGIGQSYAGSCADAPNNQYHDPVIRHNGSFVKTEGYCTDIFFTQGLGWIKSQVEEQRPFFAYISCNAPHSPFIAPKVNQERFTKEGFQKGNAGFYGMIENIDENVGRLMGHLRQWELDENTLVIFMSDNGTVGAGAGEKIKGALGQRDGKELRFYNAEMKGTKKTVDWGGTRVPAFFRWKGTIPAGSVCDALTAHIDIVPTLVEIADGEPPSDLDGRSILPLLKDVSAPWPDRTLYFNIGRWPAGSADQLMMFNPQGFSVRNTQFLLVNNTNLYDLKKDPGQTQNIIKEHPDQVKVMKASYESWWHEVMPFMVNEDAKRETVRPYHVWYEAQIKSGGIPPWTPPALGALQR